MTNSLERMNNLKKAQENVRIGDGNSCRLLPYAANII
jgi:hypothetical protein